MYYIIGGVGGIVAICLCKYINYYCLYNVYDDVLFAFSSAWRGTRAEDRICSGKKKKINK